MDTYLKTQYCHKIYKLKFYFGFIDANGDF